MTPEVYPNAIAGQVRNAIEIPLHGTYNDVSVAFLVLLLEIPVPNEKETAASRVAFNLTDALEKELNRVQKVADISSKQRYSVRHSGSYAFMSTQQRATERFTWSTPTSPMRNS